MIVADGKIDPPDGEGTRIANEAEVGGFAVNEGAAASPPPAVPLEKQVADFVNEVNGSVAGVMARVVAQRGNQITYKMMTAAVVEDEIREHMRRLQHNRKLLMNLQAAKAKADEHFFPSKPDTKENAESLQKELEEKIREMEEVMPGKLQRLSQLQSDDDRIVGELLESQVGPLRKQVEDQQRRLDMLETMLLIDLPEHVGAENQEVLKQRKEVDTLIGDIRKYLEESTIEAFNRAGSHFRETLMGIIRTSRSSKQLDKNLALLKSQLKYRQRDERETLAKIFKAEQIQPLRIALDSLMIAEQEFQRTCVEECRRLLDGLSTYQRQRNLV